MSAERDQAYLDDGCAEEILNALAQSTYQFPRYSKFSKSMQKLPIVRAAYDAALAMPTTPIKAFRLPPVDASPAEVTAHAFAPLANTSIFNSTHRPALSVPCGKSDGLPIGMMLIGKHFDESMLYQVALVFEQHEDWRELWVIQVR